MALIVEGRVVEGETQQAIPGLRVEVWREEQRLAVAPEPTDADGGFGLEVDDGLIGDPIEGRRVVLTLKVLQADGIELRIAAGHEVEWEPGRERIETTIEVDRDPIEDAKRWVSGYVRVPDGRPMIGALVQALDRDLGDAEPLGETATDETGFYAIPYSTDQLRPLNKRSADLIVRVFDTDEERKLLGTSDTVFDAPADARVDVVVELPVVERSEYEAILSKVTPVLGDRELHDLAEEDIVLLAERTGVERSQLAILVQSAKLSQETDLPTEVFYGFVRRDLPSSLEGLLTQEPRALRAALESAVELEIVPASVTEEIEEILQRFERLREARTPLDRLAPVFGLDSDLPLFERLAELNIHSLDDIRRAGGIGHLEGLPVPADDRAVHVLESHARLGLLPTDLSVNVRLVEAGYQSLDDIAGTPRETFIATLEDRIDADTAAMIHAAANVQSRYLGNVLTDLRVNLANGTPINAPTPVAGAIPQTCGCEDCENALSPMAYLADLLDYAVRHLKHQGTTINLGFLENQFHQPFGDFPKTCELMEKRVRQVRIAIEVLRKHLPANVANYTPQWYLERAYLMLLEQIGTSFDELRKLRAWPDARLRPLFDRLALYLDPGELASDVLGHLLHDPTDPTDLTEYLLEQVFGLRATHREPLDPDIEPEITVRRIDYLRRLRWPREDWPNKPPADARPLIDPDIVGSEDMVYSQLTSQWPRTPTQPIHFWEDRKKQFEKWLYQIKEVHEVLNDPKKEMEAFITDQAFSVVDNRWVQLNVGLGITIDDFKQLRRDRLNGKDITAQLDPLNLSEAAFDRLIAVWEIVNQNPPGKVLPLEWDEVHAILIQRLKRNQFAIWRTEEKDKGFTLSPQYFRLRETPLSGGTEWYPKPWRSSVEERRQWEDTLRARVEQEEVVRESLRAAVSTTEAAFLHHLRDDLIREVPGLGDKAARLTQQLQIDFKAGVCQETTRIAQAIETIQGVLFGARNGLLEDGATTLDAPHFDEEWRWIGSYATWRAAMQVFLYPENALRPSLRREKTPAFEALIEHLRDVGRATPNTVQEQIEKYEEYFGDVCSLSANALFNLPSPSHDNAASGGMFFRRALVLAEGAKSGKFYSANFTWRMKPSAIDPSLPPVTVGPPDQTLWWEGPNLPKGSEVIGALPYRTDGDTFQIALYARTRKDGQESLKFTNYDGKVWGPIQDLDSLPGLVLSFASYWTIGADPMLPSGQAHDVPLTGEEVMIPVDVDGDGRSEIVLLAPAPDASGKRRVTLLRGHEGALVVRSTGMIDGGWELARYSPPAVVRVKIPTYPWRAERLLLRRKTGAAGPELGLLTPQADGSFAVGAITGTISGSGGAPNWQVSEDAFYTVGDIDGDGQTEVIAIEYQNSPSGSAPLPPVSIAKTICWILRVANSGFSVLARQDLRTPPGAPPSFPGQSIDDQWKDRERWERFEPVRRGQVGGAAAHDFVVLTRHTQYSLVGNPTATDIWFGLLHWDQVSRELKFSQLSFVNISGAVPWVLQGAEQFLGANLDPKRSGEEIVVLSPIVTEVGVLTRAPNHQFTSMFKGINELQPSPGGSADPWPVQPGDGFYAADLDGDGVQELVITDVLGKRIGVLDWDSSGSLQVLWHQDQVSSPGSTARNWRFSIGPRCRAADIDGDGAEEIVALGRNAAGQGRIGVLRGVVQTKAERLQILPVPLGPAGVSLLDIAVKGLGGQTATRKAQIKAAYIENLMKFGRQRNLIYLDEAYYFVPMEIGLRLRESGYYTEALDWFRSVYDHTKPAMDRKIAYKLLLDESSEAGFERYAGWLRDPLNPHAIAETRRYSYAKFTILAIVRCLLDYADAEFTRATSESVPRARELYLEALELLNIQEIKQHLTGCTDLIGELKLQIGEDEYVWVWNKILHGLAEIKNTALVTATVQKIEDVMASNEELPSRLAEAQKIVAAALEMSAETQSYEALLEHNVSARLQAQLALLADPATERVAERLGSRAAGMPLADGYAIGLPEKNLFDFDVIGYWAFVPAPLIPFCIPPNRVIEAARSYAELNLHKIRTCRNIAAMHMQLEPYAMPTAAEAGLRSLGSDDRLPSFRRPNLRPLPYRYAALIERTKQLVQLAQQIENSLLASLQSLDQARYEVLKARQDLALAQAGVRLKDLQLVEATNGVTLAELQRDRAQLQTNHYRSLLSQGLSATEQAGLNAMMMTLELQMAGIYSPETLWEWAGAAAPAVKTMAEVLNTSASYERRAQEWGFQRRLSEHDVRIGQQQIRLAQDRVRVSAQDRAIAALQVEQAEAMIDFIETKKFGNAALYEWMSGVLEQVYRFFLQQATSMAQLAEAQLAFERQEIPAAFIEADYWEPPSKTTSPVPDPTGAGGRPTDVRGLTGSARLLRDITELDQYAFQTDRRKLQLTKTISLAQLDPFAFQRFRETGVLPFATPMSLFDRDFPGHYLRLVKRVRTSVIALIPPTQGIRATLSTTGTTRVVIGGDTFQTVWIQRDPETVALTAPINATGLFELDPQPEMLVPFEGIGVDAAWEFRMPKAANSFDYRTIADVLVTIDYTALDNFDHRQQIIQRLDRRVSADRAFSFRQHFADAWYDLNNPELLGPQQQMVVRFVTGPKDFPPNLEDLAIQNVALYFAPGDGRLSKKVEVKHLVLEQRVEQGVQRYPDPGVQATSDEDGVISVRRGNAAGWTAITSNDLEPFGEWELSLKADDPVKDKEILDRFKNQEIEDILFVITYSGRTPAWPL